MNYRREIDGLRAIAVLPVILFHAGLDAFSGGFVGVDVFFVISGCLITTIILSELEHGRFSIVNFYERRARRILPALFLIMFVCIPFTWLWLGPNDMKDFSQSLVAVSVFSSNFLFWRESGYFANTAELKPLLHTWSLAVEEQYYVLFPIFLIFFWQFGKRWIVLSLCLMFIVSLSLAQWAAYEKPTAAFYLLPTRVWELLIGAFAAFYLSRSDRNEFGKTSGEFGGWLGVSLIIFSVFCYSEEVPFPSFYALVPTVGAVLIILFATHETTVGQFMGNKIFVGIGLISYSAYLWHQPLFALVRHRSLNEPSEIELILLSVCALVLAYFRWKFVEAPFRNKFNVSRKGIFVMSAVASSGFIMFGLLGYYSNGFKFRFGEEFDRFVLAKNDRNPNQAECLYSGEAYPSPENYCVLGKGKIVGLLLGDSHADALAHSLSEALSKNGTSLKSATSAGCPPVENVYRFFNSDRDKCYEINKQSYDYALSDERIEYVVLLGRWAAYLEGGSFNNREGGVEYWNLAERKNFSSLDIVENNIRLRHEESVRAQKIAHMYKKSVQRLLDGGKKVILVYPIPEVGFDVPKRLYKIKLFGYKAEVTTSYDVFLDRNRRVLAAFDSIPDHKNLIKIHSDKSFCDTRSGGRCVTVKGGDIFYYDDDHLSNSGAKIIASEVVNVMK